MQFADYAALEVCAIPPFRLNRGARRSGTYPQATQPYVSMRPQPKQQSKTMQPHNRHTYPSSPIFARSLLWAGGADASPVPSSPRGRGLVEAYRPLGPLPPRAVRAVARPGPHPVADGHLVDVAALAAPPCGLAAYGLRAGGLQALAHARVPHRRYAGMRDGQVVEAGEHLASRAVRAAVVDAHEAHAHLLAPDVAARSAPPHHGACVGVEVLGAQAAVQLGVELPGDVRPL